MPTTLYVIHMHATELELFLPKCFGTSTPTPVASLTPTPALIAVPAPVAESPPTHVSVVAPAAAPAVLKIAEDPESDIRMIE